MSETTERSWVLVSDETSRAAGKLSLLAAAETLVCVMAYWALWCWWGVTWHHVLIVMATPLVLMRSDASVAKGVRWFDAYGAKQSTKGERWSWREWGTLALAVTCAVVVAWFASRYWLVGQSGRAAFWGGAMVALISITSSLAVAAAIAGASAVAVAAVRPVARGGTWLVKSAGLVALLVAGPGVMLGIWLRAVMIRTAATLRHPIKGVRALPENWRRIVWCSDMAHTPELIPGHDPTGFSALRRNLVNSRKTNAGQGRAHFLIVIMIAMPIFYLPTLLWRWSIKSTAWFYIPLIWVGRGWQNLQDPDLLIWAKGYHRKLWNIVGLLTALPLAAMALIALVDLNDFIGLRAMLAETGAPMTVVGWLVVLDFARLLDQPWQIFYLPSWVLTVLIFLNVNSLAVDIDSGAAPESRMRHLRAYMWAGNLRFVLTNIGLVLALWYFATATDALHKARDWVVGLFA